MPAPLLAACALFSPPPPIALTPTPPMHDFGTVLIGEPPKFRSASWQNVSTAAVVVDTFLVVPAAPPFTVNLPQPFVPRTVAPGATTRSVRFTFAPTAPGSFAAEGVPTSLAANPTFTSRPIALKGVAAFQYSRGSLIIGGRDLVAGRPLDFGTVTVPGRPMNRSFNLTNPTTRTLAFRGRFAKGNQGFILVSPTPPFALSPGQTIQVTIVFRPRVVGAVTDAIIFTDGSSPDNGAGTTLIGNAVPGG